MMWFVEDIKIMALYFNLQDLGVVFQTGLFMFDKEIEAFTSLLARMHCVTMFTCWILVLTSGTQP